MRRRIWKVAALVVSLSLCCAVGASAATLRLVGEFDQPIFIASDPANPDELLVVEREGRVILSSGTAAQPFADLTSLVSCCSGERGLLSIALAPDYVSSGRFYAAYTGEAAAGGAEGDLHVDAFRPGGAGEPALVREPIVAIGHADEANHNGGQIQFGPDGYLYVSVGDGGGSGDPFESGQNLDTLLGKILRIDPRPGATPSYAIPAGNPFAGQPGLDEIWSYGLRNPWRFSFDRANGDMIIGDVGQGVREEVDLAPSPAAGAVGGEEANYGWNCREGFIAYAGAPESCDSIGGFTDPVFDYPHTDPGDGGAHGCAITGGYVVRDPSLGDLFGRYLYADFCIGEIRSLVLPATAGSRATGDRSEGISVSGPVSFGEDSCGRLYVASNGGAVYRLEGAIAPDCSGAPSVPTVPGGPAGPGVGVASSLPLATLAPTPATPRARILLLARIRRLGDQSTFVLSTRVSPCAGHGGSEVQLNRGGRRIASKPLDPDCVAHFRLRVGARATFRALLPSPQSGPLRSRRLVVFADRGR